MRELHDGDTQLGKEMCQQRHRIEHKEDYLVGNDKALRFSNNHCINGVMARDTLGWTMTLFTMSALD